MSKIIITIVGKDRVGIVARTCNYLAENGMNILDISGSPKSFDDMAKELEKVGEDIGVTIRCQREEIFTSMHRI